MTTENNNDLTPIHTGTVNGQPVRFFKTPLNDGRPDFPWHSVGDLMTACGLTKHDERAPVLDATRIEWGDYIQVIGTGENVVTVAPHCMAQGLIGAMIHVGRAPRSAEAEYTMAASKAMEVLTGPLGDAESFEFTVAAFHRWSDKTKEAAAKAPATGNAMTTPYGVTIQFDEQELDGKSEEMVSTEGLALMFGIHDAAARARFVEDVSALLDAPDWERDLAAVAERHGGITKAVKIALPRPGDTPVRTTLAKFQDVTDSWVDALSGEARWCDRAAEFLSLLERQIGAFEGVPRNVVGGALSGITTAVLEELGETEIACLEAAAFYALTAHQHWRTAGREWLLPHRKTWVRDWIKDRPVYRRLARLTGMVHRDVPSWLKEVL